MSEPLRPAWDLAELPDRPDSDVLVDAAGGPAQKDADDDIDWLVSVASTIVRAHQHVMEGFRGHLGSVTMDVRRRSEGGDERG
ncbi:hypothetical protein [Streptomyces sp. NPDC096030]|uniref:hypothetical protein n=1 Tax=Streptomyces sp. NPDC096030 TaxID=3155423 RepID=UPI003322DAED